ncbi:MAG: DUF1311 domain-containing protein [Desulfovibrio sp.]|nr:DUF1311 domain-containing protein [Desulfovibrio sp.]MBR6466654.1 DUF1311 domain-containing protein [Desulfovibrio sp.]
MKRILSSLAMAALAAAFLPGTATALSEAEYSALLESSPQIADLDKRLNQEWKQALAKMKPQGKDLLRKDQRDWLRRREDIMQRIMRVKGLKSRPEACAFMLEVRIGYLRCIEGQLAFGSEKVPYGRHLVREEVLEADNPNEAFCQKMLNDTEQDEFY